MAWSVESLPCNPVARGQFPMESGTLISVLDWMCVLCVLSCVVFGDGPDIMMTTDFRISRILVFPLSSPVSAI